MLLKRCGNYLTFSVLDFSTSPLTPKQWLYKQQQRELPAAWFGNYVIDAIREGDR
ncbi:hypothetical protein BH10BAC3_BH10BAC3_06930 [soil metagenome]